MIWSGAWDLVGLVLVGIRAIVSIQFVSYLFKRSFVPQHGLEFLIKFRAGPVLEVSDLEESPKARALPPQPLRHESLRHVG